MTQDDKTTQRALSRALNLISFRPRTEFELRLKLEERFSQVIVDVVTDRLKERGLIDDDKFACEWTDSRTRRSPRSSRMIVRELVDKGVSHSVAEKSVEGLDDDATAHAAATKFAARLSSADYVQFHRKLWGHLQRRGYGLGASRRAIARLWRERETVAD